jgi:hypothetical protein
MLLISLVLAFLGISNAKKASGNRKVDAVVTLVAGDPSGYDGGAIALGQSLKNVGSKLHRVLMVTPDVSCSSVPRRLLFEVFLFHDRLI